MEKPVATDAPGIRCVLAAAQKAKEKKLNIVVGLQRHYQTVYREWVKRIHDGAIGDIILGRVYWNGGGVSRPHIQTPQNDDHRFLQNPHLYEPGVHPDLVR